VRQDIVLTHKFVEFIPDELDKGTIYVSIRFATVVHACCCGCGKRVVTPLGPTDWKLIFDGKTISLNPSIGNWGFECQSHYWIRNNGVKWAPRWSKDDIAAGRAYDRFAKERYFDTSNTATDDALDDGPVAEEPDKVESAFWRKLKKWWHRS